ncbi:MAG: ubiquitin-like small modifier protein 1 [Anaerolineae bacterium]
MWVRVYATLRDLIGANAFEVPLSGPADVRYVLEHAVRAYPTLGDKLWSADGRWSGFVTVLVNGRSMEYLQGLETPVTDRDAISLFPPVGGG